MEVLERCFLISNHAKSVMLIVAFPDRTRNHGEWKCERTICNLRFHGDPIHCGSVRRGCRLTHANVDGNAGAKTMEQKESQVEMLHLV